MSRPWARPLLSGGGPRGVSGDGAPPRATGSQRQVREVNEPWGGPAAGPPSGGGSGGLRGGSRPSPGVRGGPISDPPPIGPIWALEGSEGGGRISTSPPPPPPGGGFPSLAPRRVRRPAHVPGAARGVPTPGDHVLRAPGERGEQALGLAGRWPRLRGVLRGWPPRRVTWSERQVRDVNGHLGAAALLSGGGAYPGGSRDPSAR